MLEVMRSKFFITLMIVVIALVNALSVFAQVAITIDTDVIFTEANTWITVFTPIVAIGIGIAIALAILRFIGKQIVSAFN
jgi:hypothetical protein